MTAAGDACSDAVLSAVADLAGGNNRNYTVVANLDDHGTPNLALFRNSTRKTEAGLARLVVRHTADAPAVNVWANGSPLNRGRQFVWGAQRRFDVPAGDYEVFVSLARQSDPVIGPADLSLTAGTATRSTPGVTATPATAWRSSRSRWARRPDRRPWHE